MVTHATQQWPLANAIVEPAQAIAPAPAAKVVIQQVGQRHEQAQGAVAAQREPRREVAMDFARKVLAGPDRVPGHAGRRRAAGRAEPSPPDAATERAATPQPREATDHNNNR